MDLIKIVLLDNNIKLKINNMEKIKFEFINKEVQLVHPTVKYASGGLPFRNSIGFKHGYIGLDKTETDEEAIERVWKWLNKPDQIFVTKKWTDLPEEDFKKCLTIVEHPGPKSFPKFNNEKKFNAWSHVNPEILNIRWDGIEQTWEYRLRNVGHIYDYQKEKYLIEIN